MIMPLIDKILERSLPQEYILNVISNLRPGRRTTARPLRLQVALPRRPEGKRPSVVHKRAC